ncbi:SymE family type I addiction module toxin [Butyrivibrio sp.]|uniref:SymE family type I addiction module toxin n=1 Tax=Butyrivibrio sp. TaxID=28121 RepID=UPI0025C03D23|nr:SymE family type I addiction module toxin [Butyrivibrio sp.]MBQ9303887.1 hypothetical protein [Butyrivibrio sp.]
MTKTIKVQYSTRYTDRRHIEVPKIQMEGKWLEAIGFSVGDRMPKWRNHHPTTEQSMMKAGEISFPGHFI